MCFICWAQKENNCSVIATLTCTFFKEQVAQQEWHTAQDFCEMNSSRAWVMLWKNNPVLLSALITSFLLVTFYFCKEEHRGPNFPYVMFSGRARVQEWCIASMRSTQWSGRSTSHMGRGLFSAAAGKGEKAAPQVGPSMWEDGCLLTAELLSGRKGQQHPKQPKQASSVLADDPSTHHPACRAACSATCSKRVLFPLSSWPWGRKNTSWRAHRYEECVGEMKPKSWTAGWSGIRDT